MSIFNYLQTVTAGGVNIEMSASINKTACNLDS